MTIIRSFPVAVAFVCGAAVGAVPSAVLALTEPEPRLRTVTRTVTRSASGLEAAVAALGQPTSGFRTEDGAGGEMACLVFETPAVVCSPLLRPGPSS